MTKDNAALTELEQGLALILDSIKRLKVGEDWVDQASSPLGKRAHLEAVRSGKLRGHKVNGRVLVKRADLDAFIERHGSSAKVLPRQEDIDRDELDEVLAYKPKTRRRSA